MGAKGCEERVKDTFSDLTEVPRGVFGGLLKLSLVDQSPQWESDKGAVLMKSGRILEGGQT